MFKFKKIAAVLAGAVMMGSTIALAAAANYPMPFVQGGNANVAVVYGSTAANTDLVAVADINANLQVALASQTATVGSSSGASASGGDSVNLATSSRKLYYGEALNVARATLTSSDLPSILADGKFTDLKGTEYTYTQSIKVAPTVNSTFGTGSGELNDPILLYQLGTDATSPIYNYTISLNKNLNVSDDVNVQSQKINLMGVDYIIGAQSTNSSLYLFGSGQPVTIAGGASQDVSIGGASHTISLVAATSTTTAKITVDGDSRTVTTGSSYSFPGDISIYVKDVTYQSYAGGVQSIDLIVGANTLLLPNGGTVKVGADQTSIPGTRVDMKAAGIGIISGFTVSVAANSTNNGRDLLQAGNVFTDPVFKGLAINFAGVNPGLNDSSRNMVVVDTDNNQFGRITFTAATETSQPAQTINFVADNNTASNTVELHLAHKQLASGKGQIHVTEGAMAKVGDWIVVNQGDYGGILQVDDVNVDGSTSTGTVTFSDAISGQSLSAITVSNATSAQYYTKSGVNLLGGTGYTVTANSSASTVNLTWNSGATAVFPRIKLQNGGWIALLDNRTVTNGTSVILPNGLTTLSASGEATISNESGTSLTDNGITWQYVAAAGSKVNIWGISSPTCNFPAVLYIEPKKWDDASQGNFICVPVTTTGSLELAIGTPVFNGTNSGFTTYGSDTYKSGAVDRYGAFVTNEQRTNENGKTTIYSPQSQMYFDVLFTSLGATVTPGYSGGGSVKSLGSVAVSDGEISSVSGKNLIVVGGSCVNSVAANLLGSSSALCGADFTTKTSVGAGSFLIQTFASPYATGNVATLVAGYNAGDTTSAAKYLTTQTVDTTSGKQYIRTSATVATLQTS